MAIFRAASTRPRTPFGRVAGPIGLPRQPFAPYLRDPNAPPPVSFAVPEDPALGPQPAGVGTPAFFKQVEAKSRGFRIENKLGPGVTPLVPGLALPQRFAGLSPSTIGEPRQVFTTAPELSPFLDAYVGKDASGKEITLSGVQTRDFARAEGLDIEDYVREFALKQAPNPEYRAAQSGLSEQERDFRMFGGPAPESIAGATPKEPKATAFKPGRGEPRKVTLGDGSWYWVERDPETGEDVRVGGINAPEKQGAAGLPEYRTVPTGDPDVQRVERVTRQPDGSYKIEPIRTEWTEDALRRKQASQKLFTEQQATAGGVAALNAGVAGAPLTRQFGESTAGVKDTTFFGRAPGAGFNANAPAGSAANPYGAQGPSGSPAEVFNRASAQAESDRLRNAARAPMAASRVMADAQSGRLAQIAATPQGKAMLTSILAGLEAPLDRQRENPDDDALVAEAVKHLRQVLASSQPQRQVFTRRLGAV